EQDAALAGARIAEDRHHQGGLAGAIGADQRDDLARMHVEIDATQRHHPAVAGGDAADAEQGLGHGGATLRCIAFAQSTEKPPIVIPAERPKAREPGSMYPGAAVNRSCRGTWIPARLAPRKSAARAVRDDAREVVEIVFTARSPLPPAARRNLPL